MRSEKEGTGGIIFEIYILRCLDAWVRNSKSFFFTKTIPVGCNGVLRRIFLLFFAVLLFGVFGYVFDRLGDVLVEQIKEFGDVSVGNNGVVVVRTYTYTTLL